MEEKKEEHYCQRLGHCCYYWKDGVRKKCKNLVRLKDGKTLCRIFKTRLGTEIDKGVFCNMRVDDHTNYPGCKFNRPEWRDEQNE